MEKIIETERLILKPLTVLDAPEVFKWVSDPVVNEFMPYNLYDNVKDVEKWLSSLTLENNDFGFFLKEGMILMGSGSITKEDDGSYALGYNMNKDFWGNGYATEAGKAMIEWAFVNLGARDFKSGHAVKNIRSKRVIEKCGFVFDHNGSYKSFDGKREFEASFYKIHKENL